MNMFQDMLGKSWSQFVSLRKVLHMRSQIEEGLRLAENWMSKKCFMVCTSNNHKDGTGMMVRRVVQDASARFDTVSVENLHHLGYLDLTKFGRLNAVDVETIEAWCLKTLNLNPDYSALTDMD